jgi:two-component system cell cycle sensor histidine kinase/response regulator CckA
MSGRELAYKLVRSRPETKVLYLSGYTEDAIVNDGSIESGTAFLQKPFSLQNLSRKVREVLG